ncbi:MAG: FHA domain-containing protein [Planctomycetes bacterium]|nr:FHA domain-containing protein [Planctomycetota bacterium]
MFDLVYEQGNEELRVQLDEGATIIGRSLDCDVIIPDKSISSKHARVVLIGDSVAITDLKSSNGVLVKGKKVPSATLRAGDKFQLGRVLITVESAGKRSANAPFELSSKNTTGALKVYRTPKEGLPPDPLIEGRSKRKLKDPGAKRYRGLHPSLKFLLSLIILGLIGYAGYILLSEENVTNPFEAITGKYNSEDYTQTLLAGVSACRQQDYSAAYALWKDAAEQWEESQPDSPDDYARQLALLFQPLAAAQTAGSFLEIDWLAFDQKAKTLLLKPTDIPESVAFLINEFSQQALQEDQALEVLLEAMALFDDRQYEAALAKAGEVPKSRFYSPAAEVLAEKIKLTQQELTFNSAYLRAKAEKWGEAIALATEALKTAKNPELENDLLKWQIFKEEQDVIEQARQLIESNTRDSLTEAQRLLQSVPEDSRYYLEAHSESLKLNQKLLLCTIEEFWQKANLKALENLATENPTLRDDPRYLNILKTAGDATALLTQAEELEKNHDFEAAVKIWGDVCRMIPDQNHRYNQQASSMLEYYTGERMGELYRRAGLDAVEQGEYKQARTLLEKAAKYGVEVTAEVKMLTDLAKQFYTKSMNAHDEELPLLQTARDCLLPSDDLYLKVQKKIIDLEGTNP